MGTVASPALLGRNRPQFSQLKMMKAVVIVVLLAVSALAQEPIISYDAEDHKHEQNGDAGNAVRGSYSHTDAEGNTYTINYVADENGYRAEGEHLPVAPEVPAVPEVEAPVVEVAAKAVEVPAATDALPRPVCLQLRLQPGLPIQRRLRLQLPRIPLRLLESFTDMLCISLLATMLLHNGWLFRLKP